MVGKWPEDQFEPHFLKRELGFLFCWADGAKGEMET